MLFESCASILNMLSLLLSAAVRRDTGAEKEKGGKIRWQSQLGRSWFQNIPDRSCWLFSLFLEAVSVHLLLQRLSASAGAQVDVFFSGPAAVQALLCCTCLEGWPSYRSRLIPREFVQS